MENILFKDSLRHIWIKFLLVSREAFTVIYRKNRGKHKMSNIFLFWRVHVVFISLKCLFFDAESVGIWLKPVHIRPPFLPFLTTVFLLWFLEITSWLLSEIYVEHCTKLLWPSQLKLNLATRGFYYLLFLQ